MVAEKLMKSRRGRDDSCSCSTCFYKHYKTNKGIERTGSKIDRLYRDKYLPLRESKLIDKLERTRAVYDDIRAPFLDDSESNRNITHTKRSGSYESCNCCRCTRKFNNLSGHSDVSPIYTRKNSKRRVRFKPEFIKSEPCVCLAKFSSLLKKQSKNLQSKLKRDFSAPVLRIKIKEPSSYKINRASSQRSRVSKNFNNASRIVNAQARSVISERKLLFPEKKSGIKTNSDEMLKLSLKKPSKSRHRVGEVKYKNNNGGPKYQKELDPRLCPCPQEKLVLKIRKDSIRKFYEDLEKKRTLKHLECKSDCVQDICIPKECLDKIKLSKGKKSTKRRRKSFKQIVSKASRRKKKKSVMCQCDDTITDDKNLTPVRHNLVKFVSSKKDIRNKSLKGNTATFDRLESKTDDGNRLKRCFCTLKFKPVEPQKYTPTPDYYSHSGQSGDMKINSTQMHRTAKKSKSSCSVYGCDPNECIEEYNKRKRQITKNDFTELNENNRRVVRFGSSISFNIEFFKENKPKDTHKSVKTNTVPHNLSSKSIKSIRARKSNKIFTKTNKRKVTILDTISKNKDLEMKTNSNKIVTKLRKYAKSKSKIKSSSKDFKIENEMVDQSTKITNKDMRLMKSFECESQICVPDKCDPRLCLEKRNKQKHEITTTDFPKMISVASGVHKRKFKHVKAQSKSSFRKKKTAKYDLNTFEDSVQLESNVVPTYPKMNHRTSIGISSNFSFAIEVGRRVVPINPIESIKRHSPIFKAKKIKSPINYDSHYTQRNNKSKTSLINTMVKRCMCTLNLTKQRNRNKSMNEQFAPNVYTVNTLLTSNIEPVLAKAMSEKKLPCQIPPNEYKICNVSNSYAAWHSQIICNHMHLSQNNNVPPKKLLKQLKLQSQLKKNNLCLFSKSLSFLSDSELKKTWLVAGTPWQFAERKTVFKCESSESKLYHVSEHQTFTKSTQYWEKTYCTMNLKTIYSRNGKTKDQIQKESRNNSVRVGSNISLNIKFYKDNPCLETKHDNMLPVTITRNDDSLRSKMEQNAITSSNKASYSVPKDQRCFCTMKLQNKSHGKNIDKSKQEPSKATLKPAVSYVSRSQNTPGTKMNSISLQPQEQLLPREYIPDMCVPGECDPASCYKILYKRKLKTRSISAATKTTRKVQTGVLTQQPSFKNAKIQSQSKSHKKRNEQVYVKRQSVPYDYIDSGKQCTRFGSQIGFNVEFYKESVPTSKNYDHKLYGKKYDKLSKHIHEASVTTKTQDLRPAKSSARRGDSLIKRCFCTLKLRNKQKKPLLTEVHSVGVMAGVKNKWYSDKVLSNKENSNKGNATSVYNTTSILRKPKQTFTKEKVTKSKHGRQHITMAALLPYECEPGICDPGACNPYDCLQMIEARNLIRKNIGSGTSRLNKKSLGTSSKFGIPSKHRRIQTSLQQNDIGVSRVVPKKAKPKYDTFSSNNQCVRIGSSINFSIEFFKDNCDGILRHKTNKDADVIKISSRSHKPLTNTKAIMSNFTTKRKGTKHVNKSKEPIVNFQVSSKKQTASQLSQTRRKYFSKNKGLLPYECEPNVCIPGQCDPYKCHERIQKRIYKDCSAITVSNVRDFATNATPCYTCKSKRIQTGHHYREDATDGIRFKKSVPDHKSRNYIRIGSNFGFHIEFGKKEVDGLREDVPVDDNEYYRHKKVNRRLRHEASQSRHIKKTSQSTFARSKLQKCFCTKKFFNSSAKTANRNLEYTTNCAFVSNIIPTVNNIYNMNNNRGSQHYARLEKQKNFEEFTRHIKNNLRPKRLLKFRRNASKTLNQHKMRSYLSFDLDLYKSKKIRDEDLNKYQKNIRSDPNVIISKEKSNIKRLKGLKTIDSKTIQGQGDTEKTVLLKRCFSTFNFSTCEKKCKSEQGLVESRYETIQQELKKRYRIKYIFTDTSAAKNLHPPRAKIIKSSKIYEPLFKANNIHVFFYKCPDEYILSTKKNLIEVKRYHPNCNEDNKEKNNYIRNIYSKLHPYVDKINFRRFFKNMISRRRCVKIAETNR